MSSARPLIAKVRNLAPEVTAFGIIGVTNTLLYFLITWVALPIGAVKASVIATVVTTTLAYFANRHWTYRHHTRTAMRREIPRPWFSPWLRMGRYSHRRWSILTIAISSAW